MGFGSTSREGSVFYIWFGFVAFGVVRVVVMKLLVVKVFCMVGMFFFMLLGFLFFVKIIEADFEKVYRFKKIFSVCNIFGGGVFLVTCFNVLLFVVREKVRVFWAAVVVFGFLWLRVFDVFLSLISSLMGVSIL